MKSASILLVLAVIIGAARGAQEGGCGRAGALRCDSDGRHLSACTQLGKWWRVRDCGASNAACVDGRCVPEPSSNARDTDNCTPNTWGCKDCHMRRYCSAAGNWIEVGNCGNEEFCIDGVCKPKADNTCDSPFMCSPSAENKLFPNPYGCTQRVNCSQAGESPDVESCPLQNNFDPCTETCTEGSYCWINEPCDINNAGQFKVVLGNPSHYYLCAGDMTIFYSCPNSMTFYPHIGECLGPAVVCSRDDSGDGSDDDGSATVTSPPSGCSPGEKWPFPDNECQYYFCVSSADIKLMTCSVNTKFDATVKNCVVSSGSCTKL